LWGCRLFATFSGATFFQEECRILSFIIRGMDFPARFVNLMCDHFADIGKMVAAFSSSPLSGAVFRFT
jgi:hypothetical protein